MNKVGNKAIKAIHVGIFCTSILSGPTMAIAASTFVVKDIKVVGLQRVSVGTVLNYLPVQVGEEIGAETTGSIIRALYDTGFFQSVSLERQGNVLVVKVIERATIGSITLVGNKDIPTDKMKELLKQMNLVKGRVFQRASLERLENELKQAYNARGKYNARIETKISPLTEDRVAIIVTISEGRVSRIKEIKFVGIHDFSKNDLLPEMTLAHSGIFTYFTKKDQYSKGAMDASLEAIRSYYLDRGYLKFRVVSSQVMLSTDKKDVFITIHIEEGPQYRFSGSHIIGQTVVPKEKLNALNEVQAGDIFSRKKITETISAIGLALGDEGFGFPAINAEPEINENDKTVFINFVVDPGRHVYVRRINFQGNTKTADYVLRNVIRQDEGALLSLHNIKESERKLHLLSYIKNVKVNTTPVPGANNQVDLDVMVEEAPSAEATASIGYGTNGPQVNAAFNQHNFMGTGRSVGLNFNASYWGQQYALNYYNPFYTTTGVGRGLSVYFETVDPSKLDIASYSADRVGADINYNVLLSETSSVQAGYGFQNLHIKSIGSVFQIQNFVNIYGDNFNEIRLTAGWNRNTYDQLPFPTHGTNQQLTALFSLPATSESLAYYKSSYTARLYQSLTHGFVFSLLGNFAYGNGLGSRTYPFFENYYAGGTAQPGGQVRGYDSYSLGPLDNHGNAMGGNLLVSGSAALSLPYPLSRDNVRTSIFADAGNVFSEGVPNLLRGTAPGPLRYSAGVSLEWRSPFGPLAFSVAKPLNLQPGDSQEIFQFTLSSGF